MRFIQVIWFWFFIGASLAFGEVSVFVGSPGKPGNVEVLDETGVRPPFHPVGLQNICLLPIDFIGRTEFSELLAGEPRLREDVPRAARVSLPGERGSLYRYRRDDPGGPARFGFFVVDPNGRTRIVWEKDGTGSHGREDPVAGRIAVSSDGDAILFATTPGGGGNLIELDLALGIVRDRTTWFPPQEFRPDGLCLLADFGLGLTPGGLLRFARADAAQATYVPFPDPVPPWFGPDIVKSAHGGTAAFAAGARAEEAFVFTCGPSGDAVQVSRTPAPVSEAGFLPDHSAGPKLALSPDGEWVAWTTAGYSAEYPGFFTRECWLRAAAASASAPDLQLTGDALFEDTLNDTGVIAFFSPTSLVLLVGGSDDRGRIEYADLFRVDLSATAPPAVVNLTQTSGQVLPPYSYGMLRSKDGLYRIPESDGILLREQGNGDCLARIDVASARRTPLLDQIDDIEFVEAVDDLVLVSVERSVRHAASALLGVPFASGAAPRSYLIGPDDSEFEHQASRPSGKALSTILEIGDDEWLLRIRTSEDGGTLIHPAPWDFGPAFGFALDGSLLASVELKKETLFLRWAPDDTVVLLRADGTEGFLLPGL